VKWEPKKVAPAASRVACPLHPSRVARTANSGKRRERGRRGGNLRWQREEMNGREMDGRESRRRQQPAGAQRSGAAGACSGGRRELAAAGPWVLAAAAGVSSRWQEMRGHGCMRRPAGARSSQHELGTAGDVGPRVRAAAGDAGAVGACGGGGGRWMRQLHADAAGSRRGVSGRGDRADDGCRDGGDRRKQIRLERSERKMGRKTRRKDKN
jgi:hypothetical protein